MSRSFDPAKKIHSSYYGARVALAILQDFMRKLKDYLFGCLQGLDFDGNETQFTHKNCNSGQLVQN